MNMWRKLSIAFAAGSLGALANVIFVAVVATLGITAALGIDSPKPPMPAFLYKQIAWGGLWGFVLVVPALTRSWWQRGLVLGVLASVVALLIFIPMIQFPPDFKYASPGYLGLGWGAMFPVLVLAANSVWGLVAAYWYERLA